MPHVLHRRGSRITRSHHRVVRTQDDTVLWIVALLGSVLFLVAIFYFGGHLASGNAVH